MNSNFIIYWLNVNVKMVGPRLASAERGEDNEFESLINC